MTMPLIGDGDVLGRPVQRRHSREFKERIVAEYDALPAQTGERGSLLRRENLGRHQISVWRTMLAGKTAGVPSVRRPKRTLDQVEVDRLRKQNAKLQAELARTKLALEITGNARALGVVVGRERSERQRVRTIMMTWFTELVVVVGVRQAALLSGVSRAAH